jgi:DNA replication protein DnaC
MLHPVLEQLKALKLEGMLAALESQNSLPEVKQLNFEERLGLLVDHEMSYRENKRLKKRLETAKLKTPACFEDISYKSTRRLDKSLVLSLENCQWVREHRNILITGATGTGKTFLGESFAHKACLKGFTALSVRLPRFLDELVQARAEGCYTKRLIAVSKIDVLCLDDFGITPFTDQTRRDFLEILDDRYKKRSTIITSQLDVKLWHKAIGDATLADAILDRVVHNSYRFALEGDTMRKEETKNKLSNSHSKKNQEG